MGRQCSAAKQLDRTSYLLIQYCICGGRRRLCIWKSPTGADPDYQRNGTSQKLLHEAYRRAKEAGFKYIKVEFNIYPYEAAQLAYEKAGFVHLSLPAVEYYRPL